MLEEEAMPHRKDSRRPPRTRRKQHLAVGDELGLPELSDEDEETEHIIKNMKSADIQGEYDEEAGNMELEENPSHGRRKSVRWTDDFEGGELTQTHLALSYNRKELSFAPKTRVKVGIWSPMQKKVMIGLGIVLLVILIVMFIVVFVVVKPGSNEDTPEAVPTAGLVPFFRGNPTPPLASPLAPPSL
jgi:hypothetical protein